MSERLPRVTATELLRALEKAGWERVRTTGSHVHMRHPDRPGRPVVPFHSGRIVKLGTLHSIMDQTGMTVAELRELL
jgi:predicted RNA binding protein YcfA (HicA-like mRNA interferase family)